MDYSLKKFSLYKKPIIYNKYPNQEITLKEFINLLKTEAYKTQTDRCKQLKKEGRLLELREYKGKELDYISIAGVFTERGNEHLKQQSGYYVADIDDISNVDEIRDKLKKDKYTHLLFTSPSGGLKSVIKLPLGEQEFKEYVISYYQYLDLEFNIKGKIDKKTRDISRACFCSYDPNYYYNENAEIWKEKTEIKELDKNVFFKKYTESQLRAMLKYIPLRNAGKGLGNHTFTVMMGLIHYSKYMKKDYFPVFRWWCEQFNSGTTVEDMQSKWNEWFNKPESDKPVTIKSIVFEAYEHGYKSVEKKIKENEIKNDIVKGLLQLENYVGNVEQLYKIFPFFYDKTKNFWLWNKDEFRYERVDEIDLMNRLEDELGLNGLTVTMKVKSNYLEAFKRVGRKHHPKESPTKWIQFKDKAYSISSDEIYDVTPDYFFTNPIPWEIGNSEEIPIIEKLLTQWVGEKYKETLIEILAYCMYRDYPIHKIFCFIGSGSNGKGKFFALMRNLIGASNCASVDLDLLIDNRFEQSKIYKKLVCQMGETNFNTMTRTSRLKSLSGQDLVGFEFKGKDSIDAINYATILISTNTLPVTTDQTDGFHRRWFNIKFPNTFKANGDPIKTIPEQEYKNLCLVCIKKIKQLLDKCSFSNEKSVEEAKKEYNELSNPLDGFLKENVVFGGSGHIFKFEFFERFRIYLKKNGFREWSDREIGTLMKEKDVEELKKDYHTEDDTKRYRAYVGITWLVRDDRDNQDVPLSILTIRDKGKYMDKPDKPDKEEQVYDTIYQKCILCGAIESHIWVNEAPMCKKCHQSIINGH